MLELAHVAERGRERRKSIPKGSTYFLREAPALIKSWTSSHKCTNLPLVRAKAGANIQKKPKHVQASRWHEEGNNDWRGYYLYESSLSVRFVISTPSPSLLSTPLLPLDHPSTKIIWLEIQKHNPREMRCFDPLTAPSGRKLHINRTNTSKWDVDHPIRGRHGVRQRPVMGQRMPGQKRCHRKSSAPLVSHSNLYG